MSNFEQRWDEAYSVIKGQNKVNFGKVLRIILLIRKVRSE